MLRWELVALAYFSSLAAVAFARRDVRRARLPALSGAAFSAVLTVVAATTEGGIWFRTLPVQVLLPIPFLLAGYWVSGLFFVRPMSDIEGWLQRVDEILLERSGILRAYRSAPRLVSGYFELSYLLVYVVVPAGAVILALAGHGDTVPRYWAIVLIAEFVSYGALPWIQTRPPRVLETIAERDSPRTVLRRLNLAVITHGSIQVNTLPSGHAAGAVATALAVGSVMPAVGAMLLVVAGSIVASTVLGRYHYVVDSVLGLIVAVCTWTLVGMPS
jgi:membrane-associated phospholipid phosphatase